MYPILFTVGRWSIPTYTVLLDLGLVLGLVLTYYEGRRQLKDGAVALDLGLWAVIGGVVGGRIAFVLANWRIFAQNWAQVLRIWEGGLSFHGAFLGGLLVMVIFALIRSRDVGQEQPQESHSILPYFLNLADVVTPGLALAITFGWAACLMGGCAYGAPGEGFGYMILPDLYGVATPRFATQIAGLAFALALFVGFWLLRGHWPFSGASFLMYVLLYFTGMFFLEFTRGDEAIYLGQWRLAQILNLVLALAAAAALLVLWWQTSKMAEGQEAEGEEDKESAEGTEETEAVPETESVEGTEEAEAVLETEAVEGTEEAEAALETEAVEGTEQTEAAE